MDEGTYQVKVGFKNDGTITAVEAVLYHVNAIWPVFSPVCICTIIHRIKNLRGMANAYG